MLALGLVLGLAAFTAHTVTETVEQNNPAAATGSGSHGSLDSLDATPPVVLTAAPHIAMSADAAQINARFIGGGPYDDVRSAGVAMHQFDDLEDRDQAWRPCTSGWCAKYGDRISASLVNKRSPPTPDGDIGLFKDSEGVFSGGFVADPSKTEVLCSYPGDGGTMDRLCLNDDGSPIHPDASCVPGCGCKDSELTPCENSCTAASPSPVSGVHQCAWPRTNLSAMLHIQEEVTKGVYNELVLDSATWVANLPHSVEAVFYPKGCSKATEDRARTAHAAFVKHFGTETPLLVLDVSNWEAPFSVAAPEGRARGDHQAGADHPSAGGFNCLGSVAPAEQLDAPPSPPCLAAMGAACDAARSNSSDACLTCAANHATGLKLAGCAAHDLVTFCEPSRSILVENDLPHVVWMEVLSCDPLQGDSNCKGAYPGLRKTDGGDVPVSICKVPAGYVLDFPIPTGAEIDGFKMYPKWGCNDDGESCTS